VNLFLTDDLDAREMGKKFGLEVHGSVGIIARAYRECLIDLKEAENALPLRGQQSVCNQGNY